MQSWFLAGSHPKEYNNGIDTTTTYNGKNSGYLACKVANPTGFGTLMQMFKADDYRGKRMRFSAVVKSEDIAGDDWAGLWMRVDGPVSGEHLAFDNMRNRPIKGTTDWQQYEVVLDVAPTSVYIAFGILLSGKGKVWLSDVHFEEVGADVPTTTLDQGRYPDKPGNLDFAA
jgi:hypothetical protein